MCALTWLALAPGLRGGFLFDDFVNLDALGSMGPIDDVDSLLRYLTSGIADPTGRPLALLSFLLDARDWPADPVPFLRTNLLLHLANGVLLFCLVRALDRRVGDVGDEGDAGNAGVRADAVALVSSAAWMLHPLLVSTTLYIIQRQAMLAATFVLLGLLAWLHGDRLMQRAPRAALAWMAAGILGGTVLAVLCKANGALLPLLALVLRATVVPPAGRTWRLADVVLLVLPSLGLAFMLASRLHGLDAPIDDRAWTLGERLLTQPRVLVDYLQLLVVPRVLSTGLYNDAYVVSKDLWHPASTLPSLLALAALCIAGIALRRRAPALAAAILFFLAGHLLEAGTVPLELYFEHRNYLPAVLLPWPLARMIWRWRTPLRYRALASLALVAMLAAITWQRATLWGKPADMAALWVLQNPASSRAQATLASYDTAAGRAMLARTRLERAWRRRPDDLQLALNYANAACASGGLSNVDVQRIADALRTATSGDQLLHRWLGRAMETARRRGCRGLGLPAIDQWLAAAARNPRIAVLPGRRQDLHSLKGRLALIRGQPELALAEFNRGLDAQPRPQAAALQAAMLAARTTTSRPCATSTTLKQLRARMSLRDGTCRACTGGSSQGSSSGHARSHRCAHE